MVGFVNPVFLFVSFIDPAFLLVNFIDPAFLLVNFMNPGLLLVNFTDSVFLLVSFINPVFLLVNFIDPAFLLVWPLMMTHRCIVVIEQYPFEILMSLKNDVFFTFDPDTNTQTNFFHMTLPTVEGI